MKRSEFKELIGTLFVLFVRGSIFYIFTLCLIASKGEHYIQTTLTGLIGLITGWVVVIVMIWKLFSKRRKDKKVE